MGKTLRNVPRKGTGRHLAKPHVPIGPELVPITFGTPEPDSVTGRGDPQQRFRIYRLCPCGACGGTGKNPAKLPATATVAEHRARKPRCPECRGEGSGLDLVSTAADPQGVGVAICTLAEEGEFEDCPIGILEDGGSWLVKPWLPSPRNVADAARVLAKSKGEKPNG